MIWSSGWRGRRSRLADAPGSCGQTRTLDLYCESVLRGVVLREARVSDSASVTVWIDKLKAGEPEAAQQIWQRYYARLVELARHKLQGLSKRVCDEEDVALSAFHSFWQAAGAGRFPQLENRDDLWQLLVMHTARKAIAARRYADRQKRCGHASDAMLHQVVGREPDPQFAAAVVDEFQHLMGRLGDDTLRAIALKKLQGWTNQEIADQLDCSLRSVERKLAVIRGFWSERPDE